jgi:FKBP-type peptidyl-prolyl cis-trans isomerase
VQGRSSATRVPQEHVEASLQPLCCCCLQVIPGWEQGILGNDYIPAIKEGGARTLLVPPELAYGSTGDGCLFGLPDSCRIPPNSPVEITFKYRGLGY